MTKVCHMTSAHTNNDVRIFHKECVSLANAGYDTYLVAPGESFNSKGVHIIGVRPNTGGRINRMIRIARAVYKKALDLDADIYHFHDPELMPYGLKLAKKGKQVIFDSHEFYDIQISQKYYLPNWSQGVVRRLFVRYENRVLNHIDALIIPCTINGKNPFEGRAKRIAFISNASMLSEFDLKKNFFSQNSKAICHIGVLSYSRGITHLIKAAHVAGVKLILAGNFVTDQYESELRVMPEYCCVDYRGFLDRSGVAQALSDSEIGICTILNEGQYNLGDNFATKVYEYWAMGLPVIISDYPYARKVFERYNCGICVDPFDIDAVANAINYLLDNPNVARQMGENGRRAVLEEFNWGAEEKKLLKLYDELC